MKSKTLLMCFLLMAPCVSWAQGTPANQNDRINMYDRIAAFMTEIRGVPAVALFKDGTVLYGRIAYNGMSITTTPDAASMMSRATSVSSSIRAYFAIPPEYVWTMAQGGPQNRQLVQPIGGEMVSVGFDLKIDGVRLDDSGLEVRFNEAGKMREIQARVPRLRPEIVAAVRGPRIPASDVAKIIQTDVDAQPVGNSLMLTPGKPVRLRELELVALASPPYLAYECFVESVIYRLDATTGVVLKRMTMIRD